MGDMPANPNAMAEPGEAGGAMPGPTTTTPADAPETCLTLMEAWRVWAARMHDEGNQPHDGDERVAPAAVPKEEIA